MMQPDELKSLAKKIHNAYQFNATMGSAPTVFAAMAVLGLKGGTEAKAAIIMALVANFITTPSSQAFARNALKHAFEATDSEERLRRILQVPRVLEYKNLLMMLVCSLTYSGILVLWFHKQLSAIFWTTAMIVLLSSLVWVQARLSIEKLLRSYAMKEFHSIESPHIKGTGYLWPRQEWYLPYTFGLFLVSTVTIMLVVIAKSAEQMLPTLVEDLQKLPGNQIGSYLHQSLSGLIGQVTLPLVVIGSYVIISASVTAWRVARHQVEGSRAVQESIEALVSGNPKLPAWVSTDEIGDLAQATSKAFTKLRALSLALRESAQSLGSSAQDLSQSTNKQTEVLSRQAAALQETQVTAQEIKETSTLAFQKAETILKDTERVDQISRSGEAAIELSLSGLESIREVVVEMAQRIKELDGRTRQIGNITTTVKDLADQSNMLALNAAIEAVRSGEHGKGFAVVAREIRMLADQSIKATRGVRDILQDISGAIRTTVEITERGSAKIDGSLKQVREFGDNIRQLSSIVRENASSVRQISAAVAQQNAGISQIFQAVNELSGMMDQTMQRLRSSEEAMVVVQGVVTRVTGFVGEYNWEAEQISAGAADNAGTPRASAS